jgi:hypothetical protein
MDGRTDGETKAQMENMTKLIAPFAIRREYKKHFTFCGEGRNSINYCRASRLRALFLLQE